MICPHCSQWNPAGRPRCVFCQNELALGAEDRFSAPPLGYDPGLGAAGDATGPPLGTRTFEKEPGSPGDIAKSLRIASIVVGVVIVTLWALWGTCTGY